jgi:hypothetical protein
MGIEQDYPNGELSEQERLTHETFRNRIDNWKDVLGSLHKNEVGRAIVSEKFGRRQLLGYILPLDFKNSSHLILFRDGSMAVTEADQEVGDVYKEKMGRNSKDLVLNEERPTDILRVINAHPKGLGSRNVGRVVAINESMDSIDRFRIDAQRALKVIRHNLEERKQIKMGTTRVVQDTLNSMLGQGILT